MNPWAEQQPLDCGEARTIRKIAIVRALFLGDLLCATPAWRTLRQRFPEAEITLIGLPWARDLVARLPYIDQLLPFPGYPGIPEVEYCAERTDAFLCVARAYAYDLAIQMQGSGGISNGFVAGLGARISMGYREGADNRLSISLPYCADEHEVVRWLRLVNAELRIENAERASNNNSQFSMLNAQLFALDFPLGDADYTRADELLYVPSPAPLVGLHPGSKLPSRRWLTHQFAALADALIERYGAQIVLTGGTAEQYLTTAIRRAMHHPALDLAGETDLGTFAAVIARLDLLVTNDTGASHLAAASETPSVVLFGLSRPEQWGPLNCQLHQPIDAWALAGYSGDPVGALHDLPVEPVLEACAMRLGLAERAVGAPTQSASAGMSWRASVYKDIS